MACMTSLPNELEGGKATSSALNSCPGQQARGSAPLLLPMISMPCSANAVAHVSPVWSDSCGAGRGCGLQHLLIMTHAERGAETAWLLELLAATASARPQPTALHHQPAAKTTCKAHAQGRPPTVRDRL